MYLAMEPLHVGKLLTWCVMEHGIVIIATLHLSDLYSQLSWSVNPGSESDCSGEIDPQAKPGSHG